MSKKSMAYIFLATYLCSGNVSVFAQTIRPVEGGAITPQSHSADLPSAQFDLAIRGLANSMEPHLASGDIEFARLFFEITSNIRWNAQDDAGLSHQVASARLLNWVLQKHGPSGLRQVIERLTHSNPSFASENQDKLPKDKEQAPDLQALKQLAGSLSIYPQDAELKQFWEAPGEQIQDIPAPIEVPAQFLPARDRIVRLQRLLETNYVQDLVRQNSHSIVPGYSPKYPKRNATAEVKTWWDFYAEHRQNEEEKTLEPDLRSTINSYVKNPKVFYLGIGYDIVTPLLSTDFDEMVGVGKYEDDSFPRFKKILNLHIQTANSHPDLLPGRIDHVSFKRLGPRRFEARFTYQRRERRIIFYQAYDMLDPRQKLPSEISNGYHVLYLQGTGLFSAPRLTQELVDLLDPHAGFVSYGGSGYIQINDKVVVQEPLERFLNRIAEFERIDFGPAAATMAKSRCVGQSCGVPYPIWTLLRKTDAASSPLPPLKDLPHTEKVAINERHSMHFDSYGRLFELVEQWLSSFDAAFHAD